MNTNTISSPTPWLKFMIVIPLNNIPLDIWKLIYSYLRLPEYLRIAFLEKKNLILLESINYDERITCECIDCYRVIGIDDTRIIYCYTCLDIHFLHVDHSLNSYPNIFTVSEVLCHDYRYCPNSYNLQYEYNIIQVRDTDSLFKQRLTIYEHLTEDSEIFIHYLKLVNKS